MSAKKNGKADQDTGYRTLQNSELLDALGAPFPETLVAWVVMATRQSKRGKQGLVVPYADPRAYTDRLNNLVTAAGWTREYAVEVVHGFERRKKGVDHAVAAAKVLVVCKVTIFNLGTHSGTGEAWADDENAMTAAEAQAFKRACSCFGLGRYLYDISGGWVELDEYERPFSYPDLPSWARPSGGSGQEPERERGRIASAERENRGARRGTPKPVNGGYKTEPSSPAANGSTNGNAQSLVSEIRGLQASVGEKLSMHVALSVTGTQDIASVTDTGKLTLVRERLANVNRGMDRLRKAVEASGLERYSQVCAEIGFRGGLNDVPDAKVLRMLVERMEAARPAQPAVH